MRCSAGTTGPPFRLRQAVCPDGAGHGRQRHVPDHAARCGGHASQPEKARDPVLAAAAMTAGLPAGRQRAAWPRSMPRSSASPRSTREATPSSRDTRLIGGSIDRRGQDRERINTLIDEIAAPRPRPMAWRRSGDFPRYDATVNHATGRLRTCVRRSNSELDWREDARCPRRSWRRRISATTSQGCPGAFALDRQPMTAPAIMSPATARAMISMTA